MDRWNADPRGSERGIPTGASASERAVNDALRNRPLLQLAHGAVLDRSGRLPSKRGPGELWTLGDALEGVQIFGATGTGKTSGSGATLARSLLDPSRGGMGGLVLTVKPDEIENWREYLRDVGRPESDLIELGPERPERVFNFLAYEHLHGGGGALTQNLVTLFLAALSTGDSSVSRADPYWNDALSELLTHAIDLAALGSEGIQLEELAAIIRSAPHSRAEVRSGTWRNGSLCYRLLSRANERVAPGPRRRDLKQTVAYWLNDFPSLNERTRSIIVSSFTSKAAGLLRSPLRELLCGELTPSVCPERTHEGKVIVLNLPVKTYGEVGRFAQLLYKTVWQRATERRILKEEWRPVFLWADESQHFVTTEDALFQQTARSKFAATVYLTQNLPNYYSALGPSSESSAESLLGNLQTKIFHANGDPTTNEWAQRMFGNRLKYLTSSSFEESVVGTSLSQSQLPQIDSSEFTTLAKGGSRNGGKVEAFVFQGGRQWQTNDSSNHIKLSFSQ